MSKRKYNAVVNVKATFMNGCSRMINKCWMPLAILIITLAILFSLFRALTPWAKQYKGEVESHLSTLIGQPVIINSMETSWYWFEPVLRLNQVTVSDSQNHVLKLSKLLVGINLFSSLWHWHVQPGILYADDVHLTLRQVKNSWQIDGLSTDTPSTRLSPEEYLPILAWVLGQQKIIIKNASALIHLKDGSLLPLSALNFTAVNRSGHYRLKGEVELAQTMATKLLVLADMELNPSALSRASGQVYFSVRRFLPTQWQGFFPDSDYKLEGGKGDFEVWLDVLKGHFSAVQTTLDFRRIAWSKNGNPQSQFIQLLKANLAWKPTHDGWQLSGDQIKLRAGGIRWPENALLINYQPSQQIYRVFAKTLLIEPILSADIEWPAIMQPVLAVHPSGHLQDTQIEVKEGKIDYVLSRFTELSWKNQGTLPDVSNISGALNWQPTEGRLDLDGENTIVAPVGLPPVTFDQLNAAFEWKELSHGMRISMERLILTHPDFVFSARGALDEPFLPESRHLQLTADFSADNAASWLRYIPAKYVKPKLDDWLKHDIKQIEKASGQLTINGDLADFPFDKRPGEFSIVSRFSGVDLRFHKLWPLNRDIDGFLRVDKRTLDIDILHASLKEIQVDQVNLHMDEMGLDKETLLIHGKVDVPADKGKAYIFASPLGSYLSKLKKLDLTGLVGLELNLEVPLYPENDDVLARGVINFNNNKATFHHELNDVQLNHLSGTLQFDEHGVIDSDLKAKLLGDPVSMHIQSIRQPKPYTEVSVGGDTTIDALREKLDLPIFSFMEGHVKIDSKLTLTDDPNDLDKLKITTSLQGVDVDLPMPLGKSSEESAPLTIDVDFNAEKALRLRVNYDNRLSSDLWFAVSKGIFKLDRGEIRVGGGKVLSTKQPGVQLLGSLSVFDYEQWNDVFSKLSSGPTAPNLADSMQLVDLRFGKVAIWGKKYPEVSIKANKVGNDIWSIKLDQPDVAGNLRYEHPTKTLSGRFERLYLPKSSLTSQLDNTPSSTLKPSDIPNLNVTIDTLKLGDVNLGNVALKSTSTDVLWHLDFCNIKSPAYFLTIKGDWSKHGDKNNTNLQANLQMSKLGDSLQSWHITPVVDAHKGDVQLNGNWPGAINDFSLTKVNGQMYMEFKDGRITHLSPETEEKLGLGKLLSILSLQTIPRRLKLDFSDLSKEGYSFDVFKGNFKLKKGVMNTSDCYIDGPVAYASMKGDLDVVKQLYDLDLHISPHITASLPVVATIAGGPIAGIAAWVASKIINQGMQTVTGYTYKVSGPWLNPIVQQVSIFKKKPLKEKMNK